MRLIDADALMREFAEFVRESNNSDFAKVPTWNDAVSLLGSAPTIDPVRHGKWNETGDRGGRNYACGCCRFSFIVDTCMGEPMWNYCPNCGAKMDGGEMRPIDADAIPVVSADPYEEAAFRDTIADMPAIDPVKHGKWTYDDESNTGIYAICSACGESVYQAGEWLYCPRCGAKMEDEDDA